MDESTRNPNSYEPFERRFAKHGIRFTLVNDFPLEQVRFRQSAQVRTVAPLAPAREVREYEIHMRAGDVFPPIVLWGDPDRADDPDAEKILLDGNTRLSAARRLDRTVLPAYILRCKNETQALMIAAALNQLGGRRLNPEESRDMAIRAMDAGDKDEWIARELGVNAHKVRRWRKEKEGAQIAERLGVADQFDMLPRLQKQKLADVHDEPFKAAVETLADRTPKPEQFTDMMKQVRDATSDGAAVDRIRELSEDWEPAGKISRARPPRSAALAANKFIGGLVGSEKQPHTADFWVDLEHADTLLPRWRELLALAETVVAEYDRLREQVA